MLRRQPRATADRRPAAWQDLELLSPGAQLDLLRPGAALLLQHVRVGLRDGVGVEQGVRRITARRAACAAYATVYDEMGNVDTLRRELARHALCQPTQRELAHGEGRRQRIAFPTCRGAGEQARSVPLWQHAFARRMRH